MVEIMTAMVKSTMGTPAWTIQIPNRSQTLAQILNPWPTWVVKMLGTARETSRSALKGTVENAGQTFWNVNLLGNLYAQPLVSAEGVATTQNVVRTDSATSAQAPV